MYIFYIQSEAVSQTYDEKQEVVFVLTGDAVCTLGGAAHTDIQLYFLRKNFKLKVSSVLFCRAVMSKDALPVCVRSFSVLAARLCNAESLMEELRRQISGQIHFLSC